MNKPEVILHIGSHKTGSSALQSSLHVNKSLLRSKGIYYGNYHELWKMHHNLAFGLFKEALEEELISFQQTNYYFSQIADNSRSVIERITSDIETAKEYDKILISSEGLFGPGNFFAFHSGIRLNEKQQHNINEYVIAKLKQLLSGFDVRVVGYLRRQDLILESFYNQYCKGPDPGDILPLPTFEQYYSKRPVVMNYYDELSSWAKYFGKENIIVRPYEKRQLPRGVVYDFYINILGFSENEYIELESIDENEGNSRINRDVLEFKRLLQINGLDVEFLRTSNVLGDTHKNQSFLNPDQRNKIIDECKESNEKVAKEFLDRKDGLLFHEVEIKKMDVYEGLTLEKSIEISKRLTNLLVYEKKQQLDYIKNLTLQIEQLNTNYSEVVVEREGLREEKSITVAERESLKKERDSLVMERESLIQERDILAAERHSLRQTSDFLVVERESLRQEKDILVSELEKLREDRDTVIAELHRVYESKSWRISKPLRFLKKLIRKMY